MKQHHANVSREGRRWIRLILSVYVKDMINDGDYERLEREIISVMQAERMRAFNLKRKR